MRIGRLWQFAVLAAIVLGTPGVGVNGMEKSKIDIPKGWSGIVTYGTLMFKPFMERCLGRKCPGQVYRVHLAGFIRGWEFRRPLSDPASDPAPPQEISATRRTEQAEAPVEGLISLNVYPEKGARLNGVLYILSDADLLKVDEIESGYRRLDVTDKIEEYDFAGGKVYVYEGLPEDGAVKAADPARFVLMKEYLDRVVRAADAIGGEFRAEYDETTRPIAYRVV